ncbi:MAG: hypothetical protein S4CHLAM102_01600 [Chlamydiia bacterium]|nr:hypothetical protein [Chlamydiia bacterium]
MIATTPSSSPLKQPAILQFHDHPSPFERASLAEYILKHGACPECHLPTSIELIINLPSSGPLPSLFQVEDLARQQGLIDPLSLCLYKDPMKLNCGHTFSLEQIENSLKVRPNCPICRERTTQATYNREKAMGVVYFVKEKNLWSEGTLFDTSGFKEKKVLHIPQKQEGVLPKFSCFSNILFGMLALNMTGAISLTCYAIITLLPSTFSFGDS